MIHTPGPWKDHRDGRSDSMLEQHDNTYGRATIARTLDPVVLTEEEMICNARLIAAAPALLASLRDLENILSGKPYNRSEQGLLNVARSVIARAEGKTLS